LAFVDSGDDDHDGRFTSVGESSGNRSGEPEEGSAGPADDHQVGAGGGGDTYELFGTVTVPPPELDGNVELTTDVLGEDFQFTARPMLILVDQKGAPCDGGGGHHPAMGLLNVYRDELSVRPPSLPRCPEERVQG
jgi:hypothetical protein